MSLAGLSRLALTATLLALRPAMLAADGAHVVLISIDGFAAYHLDDPALDLPEIRALIAAGARAESSETVFPSVTHPAHTSIVTGVRPREHGVLSNNMTNRETGERFHVTNRPRSQSVRVPTLFDAARARGLRTAAFWWPETWKDPALDRSIPEVFTPEHLAERSAADPAYVEELRAAGAPIDLFYDGYGDPLLATASDVALARVAAYELGARRPHLLAIHLSATDALQHDHGPDHYLAKAALTTADGCVGLLRRAAEDAGILEDTTFVITADHGFHTVAHEVNVLPLFRRAGLADAVRLHAQGWALFVETTPAFDPGRHRAALDAVLAGLPSRPGIARVVPPEGFHELGLPRYEEDPHVAGQYLVLGDIDTFPVADPESDASDRRPLQRPHHGHGYLPEHPRMYPLLVLSGRGVRKGALLGHVSNLDIAPTVAQLLGLEMSGLRGRVLVDALESAGEH